MHDQSTRGVEELIAEICGLRRDPGQWRDALGLAWKLDLTVRRRERTGAQLLVDEQVIEVDRSASWAALQTLVAREVARWALLQWELLAPETVVQHVAERVVQLAPVAPAERSLLALASSA